MNEDSKFRALTPLDTIKLDSYDKALQFAFSSEDVRNIALSGPYGSGKSSVILSYEKSEAGKNKRFIHISLAKFHEPSEEAFDDSSAPPEEANSNDNQHTVNTLEGKILNQLLHQIDPKQIPLSEFKTKREQPRQTFVFQSILTLLFVLLLFYVTKFDSWTSIIQSITEDNWLVAILGRTATPHWQLAGGILCALLAGAGLYQMLKNHVFQRVLRKIDIKGVEMELFEGSDDSFFDKHLNEVLYLFRKVDADAIVFEDLDRYNIALIFEKLREINDLIYRSGYRKKKKGEDSGQPLRFLYLIRNDVFTSVERSKFFDFIIPIVPVIDTTNSCDILLQEFRAVGLEGHFNRRFLQDVSLYLSDMRMVRNIVNEYLIYDGRLSMDQKQIDECVEAHESEKLDTTSIPEIKQITRNADRQLAMIIYKNLYPEDFDLLHQGRGYVYALMQNGDKLRYAQKETLSEEIKDLRERLTAAEQEALQDIDELNALFFPLTERVTTVDGQDVSTLSRKALVKQVLEAKSRIDYTIGYGTQSLPLDTVQAKKEKMENDNEYKRRAQIILDKDEAFQKKCNERIESIQLLIQGTELLNISELLNDTPNDDAFWDCDLPPYERTNYVTEIQKSAGYELLKYLIRNGSLDENYAIYMGYFYPGSLTHRDKDFLLALTEHRNLPYDYHLDNPKAVIERLDRSDFSGWYIYNYDLFEYLLTEQNYSFLTPWLDAMERSDYDNAFEFPVEFWRTGRSSAQFICIISKKKPAWFSQWKAWDYLVGDEWQRYALDLFDVADDNMLSQVNKDGWLTEAISNTPNFIQLDTPHMDTIMRALVQLDVRFLNLSYRKRDLPIVAEIYRQNRYALTVDMIKIWLQEFWTMPDALIQGKSWSCIRQKPEEPLYCRVQEDIDIYMEAILGQDSSFHDEVEAALELLNNEEISKEHRIDYGAHLETVLPCLEQVDDTALWPALLEKRCVSYTWENVADYYKTVCHSKDPLDTSLLQFLSQENVKLPLRYSLVKERIGANAASNLFLSILRSEDIPLERYKSLLSNMTIHYTSFSAEEISAERLLIIFEAKIISMNENNVDLIRKNYPDNFTDFVLLCGAETFADLVKDDKVTQDEKELESLLEDQRLKVNTAIQLIDALDMVLPLSNHSYPPAVKAHIIVHYFDSDDIEYMMTSFEKETPQVQEAFSIYAKNHIDAIVNISEQLELMPQKLYADCLDIMEPLDAKTLRAYLPNRDFEKVCTSLQKPVFADTDQNRKILQYFVKQGWISSFKADKKGVRAFPKQKSK